MAVINLTPQYYETSAALTNGRYTLNPGTSTSYYVTIPASSTIDLCEFGLDYFQTNNTISSYELYITIYNTWQTITVYDENDNFITSIDKDINGNVLPTGWSSTTPTTNVQRFLIPFALLSGHTIGKIRIITSSGSTCRFYGARLSVTYTAQSQTTTNLPYGYRRAVLTPTAHVITSSTYASTSNCLAGTDNTAPTVISSVPSSTYSGGGYYIGGFDFSQIPSNAKVVKWRARVKAFTKNVDTTTTFTNTIDLPNGSVNVSSGKFYFINYNTGEYINLYSRGIPPKEDNYTGPSDSYIQQGMAQNPDNYNESNWYVTQVMGHERDYGGQLPEWDELKNLGNNLYLKITLRNTTSGQPCFLIMYGAEIEVIYYIHPNVSIDIVTKDPNNIQIQLDDEINAVGASVQYNSTHTLRITPPNSNDYITVLENYKQESQKLTGPLASGTYNFTANLGQYSLISGNFSGSGGSYFQSIVGNGYNASQTTSNYYSSGSSVQAIFTYDVGITQIPSNASITGMYLQVNGHAENASNANEYMCVQLKSGNTYFSTLYNFKSAGTSNTTQTITANTIPTIAELAEMKVECTLGYYGGAINGATLYVTAEVPDDPEWSYTFTATEDTNFIIYTDTSTTANNLKTLTLSTSGTSVAKFEPFQPGIEYKIPSGTQEQLKITPSCRIRPVFLTANNIDVTNSLIHTKYPDCYEIHYDNYYQAIFHKNPSCSTEFNVLKGAFSSASDEHQVREDIMTHLEYPNVSECHSGSSDHLLLSFEIGMLLPRTAHIESVYHGGFISGGANDQSQIADQYFNYRIMSGNKTIFDFKKDWIETGYAGSGYGTMNQTYAMTSSTVFPASKVFVTPEDIANLTFEIEVGRYGGSVLPGVWVDYKDQGDNYTYTFNCTNNLALSAKIDSYHTIMQKTNNGWSYTSGRAHTGQGILSRGTSCAIYKNNHWEEPVNIIQTFKNYIGNNYKFISVHPTGLSYDFNPGNTVIYTNTSKNDLKQYLTVYCHYNDGRKNIISPYDYNIIGTLTEGTSTMTVSFYNYSGYLPQDLTIEIPNVVAAPTT